MREHSRINQNYVYTHQNNRHEHFPIVQQQRVENNFPKVATSNFYVNSIQNRQVREPEPEPVEYRQTESIYHILFVKKTR